MGYHLPRWVWFALDVVCAPYDVCRCLWRSVS